MLRGVAIVRTVALVLTVGVVASERNLLTRPTVAWSLLVLAAVLTGVTMWLSIKRPETLLSGGLVAAEILLGAALLLADGFVFHAGHVGSNEGGLAGSWPIAGALTAGIAFGPWIGLLGGAILGTAHVLAAPVNGVSLGSLDSSQLLAFVSSFVLFAIIGVAAGFAVRLVRSYDDTMAFTRAREEMARVVHDGVLQTLALIPRRSDDAELIRLAREQDRELRRFFLDAPSTLTPGLRTTRRSGRITRVDLELRIREAASRHIAADVHVDVLVAEDTPSLSARRGEALLGACSEALANIAKHTHAARVTIFVEPIGRTAIFCSIKDNGEGFNQREVDEGLGIRSSIKGRVHDAGGRVEVSSSPGNGTEVRLWV